MKYLLISIMFIQLSVHADDFKLDFGLVLHNPNGEPVGFQKTTKIPLDNIGQSSLYGLVVTNESNQQFSLNSIHIIPSYQQGTADEKIMGKTMLIRKRGAILMRTELSDQPGEYIMEVYINNRLHQSINYQLIATKIAKN